MVKGKFNNLSKQVRLMANNAKELAIQLVLDFLVPSGDFRIAKSSAMIHLKKLPQDMINGLTLQALESLQMGDLPYPILERIHHKLKYTEHVIWYGIDKAYEEGHARAVNIMMGIKPNPEATPRPEVIGDIIKKMTKELGLETSRTKEEHLQDNLKEREQLNMEREYEKAILFPFRYGSQSNSLEQQDKLLQEIQKQAMEEALKVNPMPDLSLKDAVLKVKGTVIGTWGSGRPCHLPNRESTGPIKEENSEEE